jgi:hypothetical protein
LTALFHSKTRTYGSVRDKVSMFLSSRQDMVSKTMFCCF